MKDARRKAWVHAAINQVAFPGMGTILAGRRVGWVQAVLMVAGFILFTGFMMKFFLSAWQWMSGVLATEEQFRESYRSLAWAGKTGGALCVLAWVWSLVSSFSIIATAGSPAGASPPPFPSAPAAGPGRIGHGQTDSLPSEESADRRS